MKTILMLVIAGGLYAADGSTTGSFGKPQTAVKPQVKSRSVTNIYKPVNNALQFIN